MKWPDPKDSPGYQLWLAANAWQRMVRKALHPLELTNVQFAVLSSTARLTAEGAIVAQVDVCRTGMIDANMASEVVRGLETRGLLKRLEHPNDRRAHRLVLTPEGEEVVDRGRALLTPLKDDFFAPLGEDANKLAAMLAVVVEHANRRESGTPCTGD